MSIRILIIHESGVLGTIIQKTIEDDLKDTSIDRVESIADISDQFRNQKYDIVISQREMQDIKYVDIYKLMKSDENNCHAAFIMLTSSIQNIDKEIKESGIKFVLQVPFSPFRLREIISRAADLRLHRVHERYNVPQTLASITIGDYEVEADVFNISLSGILCGFELPENLNEQNILSLSRIDISFSKTFDSVSVKNIFSLPVRIDTVSYNETLRPKDITIAYKFVNPSQGVTNILSEVFEKYSSEYII